MSIRRESKRSFQVDDRRSDGRKKLKGACVCASIRNFGRKKFRETIDMQGERVRATPGVKDGERNNNPTERFNQKPKNSLCISNC